MRKEKIVTWSKKIDNFLKFFQTLIIIFSLISLAVSILINFVAKNISTTFIKLGPIKIKLIGGVEKILKNGNQNIKIMISFLISSIILITIWYIIKKVREIIAPMKLARPFEQGLSKKIKKLGYVVLVSGTIIELFEVFSMFILVEKYNFDMIFDKSIVESIHFDFKIHISFVIVALSLFFISFIFAYGEELQKENDELL